MLIYKKNLVLALFIIGLGFTNIQITQANDGDIQSYNEIPQAQEDLQKNKSNQDNFDNNKANNIQKRMEEPLNTTRKAVDVLQGLKGLFRR